MIEKLRKETLQVKLLGIICALTTMYALIFRFDSYAWLMLGFFTYCSFVYIKGNLRAIEYYKKQFENNHLDNL